jgi:tRNA-dihydrouridine synthase A
MLTRFSIAPMMGCTDRHCRFLFRLLSPNVALYSEMLTTGALIYGDCARLLEHREDHASYFQLGGSNPAHLAEAAQMVERAGYQQVNLNCGCPSDRVQQGGIGACLMAEPALVAECFSAMNDAVSIPVTIKSRIGIDDRDDYKFFYAFIEQLYNAGCRHFQVHARVAILKGLSPRENREIPPLKYDYVRRIQQDFPDCRFALNGGIKTAQEAISLLNDFPEVMLGRAPYSNPYLVAELEREIYGTPAPSREAVVASYREYILEELSMGTHIKHTTKHLLGLFTGQPGARAFRRHLSTHMYAEDADISILDSALDLIHSPTTGQSTA